ncbi:MAG TPA: PEP/pyruvate-binding domain-containing protein [Polyangiaceae bacterium]|nr:PEP/pyruvate-binding domain-containing protein [Polyangiaceae bacterium]
MRSLWITLGAAVLAGCGNPLVDRSPEATCEDGPVELELSINEIMSNNDGAVLDDQLETEDYVEIVNVGDAEVRLSDFEIGHVAERRIPLPDLTLDAGERVVLYADDSPGQGELHLPLKFSADGEVLQLWKKGRCQALDRVQFPDLAENEVYARYPDATGEFETCRYASAGRANGDACEPAEQHIELDDIEFEPYDWPEIWPEPAEPLDINEVALPEDEELGFVELLNTSENELSLDEFMVRLAPQPPGTPWPTAESGVELTLSAGETLEPGKYGLFDIDASMYELLEVDRNADLVVSVFERDSGDVVTRLDFMMFPEDAALARPASGQPHVFCQDASPGARNECEIVEEREVGSRLRYLRTPTDFEKLARGGTSLDSAAVKVVIDLDSGGVVHLLSSDAWDIHFTFAREVLMGLAPLDRCDPAERAEYDAGWWEYSAKNYFAVEGRSYFGATLVEYPGYEQGTLEFAVGDVITGEQMRDVFFMTSGHTLDPRFWTVRPQAADQIERARDVESTLPLVGPNAPFSNIDFQPLSVAEGYGVLEFIAAEDLNQARLGPDVIVVTDDVPNDIPLVGGLITEAFQTPLSHVNVLSQNRGTPNMALSHARDDERIAPYLGELVHFEVTPAGFEIARASSEAANAFWESRRPSGDPFEPRLDLERSDFVALETASFADLPFIGGKAAQFAEMYQVSNAVHGCGDFAVPPRAFAVPMAHFWKHAEQSGARDWYLAALDDPDFLADYHERQRVLEEIQDLILDHPVDGELMADFEAAVRERYGSRRIRMRSSSNAEDLPGFNGAGLYTSEGMALDTEGDSLEDSLRVVWASLYRQRAHDERQLANIDHRQVAMAVLVHEAYRSERAQGVGVSRNVLDPVRSDIHYINAQIGEASVVNPAPGITTEQIIYERLRNPPTITYRSHSNLVDGNVLEPSEIQELSCALHFLNEHFSSVLDPDRENPYFAIEVEYKFIGAYRDLLIKQTRQHPIVVTGTLPECRMY